MRRKHVIAYLHTHWDREWYREFEVFRLRLLRVFDNVLTLLENNKIPSFYFDGQVSALLDYLEMRPEKEKLVRTLIRNKKLFIGPFYCLIDEFLTDKTCFEKNLEIGMKTAIDLGCTDFIGYLPDTFGHSQNIPDILMDFGIDKAIVWRGCGDFPAEFKWCGIDTVNLVRGYFQDVFSMNCSIEEKAEILKKTLDIISEKSGEYLLLPLGADHLGIPMDIQDQILAVNTILRDEYHIRLGSPFEYFKSVEDNFNNFIFNNELRDSSKTFILQGCYSSRLDLKRLNVEASYKLDLANRFIRFSKAEKKYNNVIEYAYKLLLQNQAHDSICGCSIDDVHYENLIRYKKVIQISDTIIEELKFENNFEEKIILNLSEKTYSGIIEFESIKRPDNTERISTYEGFEKKLLYDINKIPITEDYKKIHKYIAKIKDLAPDTIDLILPEQSISTIEVSDTCLKNQNIELTLQDGNIFVNEIPFSLIDFIDIGDSYNNAPKIEDTGKEFKVLRSKVVLKTHNRSSLKIDFEGRYDIISLIVSLENDSEYLKFEFNWNNSQKNHILNVCFDLHAPIKEVYSEDLNILIKREFDAEYNIRKHLPKEKGLEAKTNTAPMQRGLLIDEAENNIGVVTKGLTQYEVFENKLLIPILRATGKISNPQNPARTTPAGPPLDVASLQMLGDCNAEFYVFFGNQNTFKKVIDSVYNYIIT